MTRALMNSRHTFVAIGLAVNGLALGRGVIFMFALDFADLGFVALVQAAITFVGMLHFGVLNGGYRLLCHAGPRTRQRLVDLAYTGFATITAGLSLAGLALAWALGDLVIAQIAAFSVLGGVATLMRSWMMNEMVAGQRLSAANAINASSTALSMAPLLWLISPNPPLSPALIAVSAIVAQPLIFAVLAFASGAVLRPRAWATSRWLGRIVMRAGFSLFAAGLALQMIPLLERAYVSRILGLEALGHLYLAFLFVTLFQMVPNLVQQVYLAPVVERWRAGDAAAIRQELRRLLWVLIAYCGAVTAALALVAQPLVTLILPQHAADLRWVYALAPGLMVFALSGPFSLSYNVMIEYRWYLIAYFGGAAITTIVFLGALVSDRTLSLDEVVGLRSVMFALMGITLMVGARRVNARAPEFRLFGGVAAAT